jgi:hypothetical protein
LRSYEAGHLSVLVDLLDVQPVLFLQGVSISSSWFSKQQNVSINQQLQTTVFSLCGKALYSCRCAIINIPGLPFARLLSSFGGVASKGYELPYTFFDV